MKRIFIDIATVVKPFSQVDDDLQLLFKNKMEWTKEQDIERLWSERAHKYAQWSELVCVSFAYERKDGTVHVVHENQGNERTILDDAMQTLLMCKKRGYNYTAGIDIIEYMLPYLLRKCQLLGVKIPSHINLYKLKPWEIACDDIMKLWQAGRANEYPTEEEFRWMFGVEAEGIAGQVEIYNKMMEAYQPLFRSAMV